jgi:hypothetical protein
MCIMRISVFINNMTSEKTKNNNGWNYDNLNGDNLNDDDWNGDNWNDDNLNDDSWNEMKIDVFYGNTAKNPCTNAINGNSIWYQLVEEEFEEFNTNYFCFPYLMLIPKCIFQMILEDFCSGKEFVNLSMVSHEFETVICKNKNYGNYTWKYYCFIYFE